MGRPVESGEEKESRFLVKLAELVDQGGRRGGGDGNRIGFLDGQALTAFGIRVGQEESARGED